MEICIKWNMCRVCLLEDKGSTKGDDGRGTSQMSNLFNEDKKLVLHIYELFGVFMKSDDSLPDKICRKCISIIYNALKLRKLCRSSNKYLQSVIQRTKSASSFFRPEPTNYHLSDDYIDDDKYDSIKIEVDHTNVDIQKDSFGKSENSSNILNKDVSENGSMELEEMIEISEEIQNQTFIEPIDEYTSEQCSNTEYILQDNNEISNKDIKFTNSEEPELQNFCVASGSSNLKNTNNDDTSPTEKDKYVLESHDTDDPKENNESWDGLEDAENQYSNSSGDNESLEHHEEPRSVLVKEFEVVSLEGDESLESVIHDSSMVQLEEIIDNTENHAQVSSTVDTNDEIECYQHHSDASELDNHTEEEYLLDHNVNNSNTSRRKSSSRKIIELNSDASKIKIKPGHVTVEKRNGAVSQRRRTKRIFHKSASANEVKVSVCELCGNKFTNRGLLNIHMKVHLKQKNHQCELCPKSFITACNLQAHMRIHTGERPFQCKYCERRFNDRSSHLRHERTHTNEKPFECDNCGKSFSLATTLQNHLKVHSNERLYTCEPCGKYFKLPHHLKTHRKTILHRSMSYRVENTVPENKFSG